MVRHDGDQLTVEPEYLIELSDHQTVWYQLWSNAFYLLEGGHWRQTCLDQDPYRQCWRATFASVAMNEETITGCAPRSVQKRLTHLTFARRHVSSYLFFYVMEVQYEVMRSVLVKRKAQVVPNQANGGTGPPLLEELNCLGSIHNSKFNHSSLTSAPPAVIKLIYVPQHSVMLMPPLFS